MLSGGALVDYPPAERAPGSSHASAARVVA